MDENARTLELLARIDPKEYCRNILKHRVRRDARNFEQHRGVKVVANLISDADVVGSSIVSFGQSKMACTVNLLVGRPSEESPDEGDIVINVNLWPVCSPKYESRSKHDDVFRIQSALEALLDERADVLDMRQLCIIEGSLAYRVIINLACISDAGNLIDVSVFAMMSALSEVTLPGHEFVDGEIYATRDGGKSLVLKRWPVSVTCSIFTDVTLHNPVDGAEDTTQECVFLVDPSDEEEAVADGTLVCVFDAQGNACYVFQCLGYDERVGVVDIDGRGAFRSDGIIAKSGIRQTELLRGMQVCKSASDQLRSQHVPEKWR